MYQVGKDCSAYAENKRANNKCENDEQNDERDREKRKQMNEPFDRMSSSQKLGCNERAHLTDQMHS